MKTVPSQKLLRLPMALDDSALNRAPDRGSSSLSEFGRIYCGGGISVDFLGRLPAWCGSGLDHRAQACNRRG